MQLNFLLREMTHLRYFIPIIEEGNRRGVRSKFFIVPSYKYNCPIKHKDACNKIMNEYNVGLCDDYRDCTGLFFANETSGLDIVEKVKKEKKCKIIITTYQTDFIACYSKYYNAAHRIMMPSKNIAKHYGFHTDKNLYVGIAKYDIKLDKEEIINRYGINKNKRKVLLMWPKSRDLDKFPVDIIQNFNEMGWQVLVKARGKDPIGEKTKQALVDNNNLFFYDGWYPHTSQELLEVSDLVVNCGSTTIEECVMHEVPIINFDIKPEIRHGVKQKHRVTHSYLYDYEFCINFKESEFELSTPKLNAMVNYLLQKNLTPSFKKCKREWLYDHKNTCKTLLDMIL